MNTKERNCISVLAKCICDVKVIRFQHYSSKQIMKIMGNNKYTASLKKKK